MCGCEHTAPIATVERFLFVQCRRCLFAFAPAVTREGVRQRYQRKYDGPRGKAPGGGWTLTLDFLRPALAMAGERRRLTVFDFGAGDSAADDLLRHRGHRVVGLDTAPPLIPHPDRITGELFGLRLEAEQFDLVFSFQVFEHLPEPAPVLDELLRIAKVGAPVLVHTDMETPEREAGLEQWWYAMPPDHCSLYRHRTFERFAQRSAHRLAWADDKRAVLRKGG